MKGMMKLLVDLYISLPQGTVQTVHMALTAELLVSLGAWFPRLPQELQGPC